MKKILITLCSLVLALGSTQLNAAPLGTAFTYQGRLTDGANPANGTIPMVFGLWDAPMSGLNVGSPSSISSNVTAANGLFTIDLDFGATAFSGDARWLEIRVNGTLLMSRQRVAPTPTALYASTAGTVKNGAVQANQLGTAGATAAGQILTYNGSSLVWQTPGGPNLWSVNGNNDAYYNGGNVGIGTTSPTEKLHVSGRFLRVEGGGGEAAYLGGDGLGNDIQVGSLNPTVQNVVMYNAALGNVMNVVSGPLTALANWDGGQVALTLSGEKPSIIFDGDEEFNGNRSWLMHLGGNGPGNLEFYVIDKDERTTDHVFTMARNRNVGIGTTAPSAKLDVNGNINYGQLTKLDVADNFAAYIRAADFNLGHSSRHGSTGRALVDLGDTLAVNFASDWANTSIGGNNVSVCSLTIRGGCDVAEPFQMSTSGIPKGAVVVIDEENAGKLKLSTRAYDNRVAGIVSGANGVNPGIALHQEGALEGGQNVALSGRVYVQADASSGPITPGDLLTTSDTPGHAMKVTDHTKAQGAILGKAMSALKEGKGMVLVLVSLQ